MKVTRVLLVDDHELVRTAIAARLQDEDDMEVVGTAGNAHEGLTLAINLAPDVVVMDIELPGPICFEVAETIQRRRPDTRILFLSAYSTDHHIERALKAQARGYVKKVTRSGYWWKPSARSLAAGRTSPRRSAND